jgi:hypothetical protein
MTRRACTAIAVAAVLLGASLFAASSPRASTNAGAICPTFSKYRLTYSWSVIGRFSCKTAKPWLVKLIGEHVRTSTGTVRMHKGPKGLKCFAEIESKGRATVGLCYSGTFAYPTNGFSWSGR